MSATISPALTPLPERIRISTVVTPSGCWQWTAHIDRYGYGRMSVAGMSGRLVHRVSYEHYVGPIPEGMQLDHLCRNTACVNPEHLEPVTNDENMRRRYADMTHCGEGHKFTPENTYMTPAGSRRCRACQRAACARYKANRKASS